MMGSRSLAFALVGLAILVAGPGVHADVVPPGTTLAYELESTWSELTWPNGPGWFRSLDDVSTTPDGTVAIVDRGQGRLHFLSPDGEPRSALDLAAVPAAQGWQPLRVDGGPDQRFYLLMERQDGRLWSHQVLGLTPSGAVERQVALGDGPRSGMVYADLAVGPDGLLHVSRQVFPWRPDNPPGIIEVYDPTGGLVDSFRPADARFSNPTVLDIAPDGTAYVANQWSTQVAATTYYRHGHVLVLSPDGSLSRTVEQSVDDVAAGPTGAFAVYYGSRALHRLGAPYSDTVLRTALHAAAVGLDGRIHALGIGERFGVTTFHPEHPELGLKFVGSRAARDPVTPAYPRRLDVDAEAAVLQERYTVVPGSPPRRQISDRGPSTAVGLGSGFSGADEPDEVQRWSRQGLPSTRWDTLPYYAQQDVATDGVDTYVVSPEDLWRWSDQEPQRWLVFDNPCVEPYTHRHFIAVSAEAGRVALLDGENNAVLLYDREGTLQAELPVDPDRTGATAVDIALGGGRIYLAEAGARRVMIRGLDGALLGVVTTHDMPERVSTTAEGDLVVLGRGGWVLRYAADGVLVAWWSLPEPDLVTAERSSGHWIEPGDAGIDAEGRVYVPWVEKVAPPPGRLDAYRLPTAYLPRAGVWVFAPVGPGGPAPSGCLFQATADARPSPVEVGGAVDVALRLAGTCAPRPRRSQTVLVLDTAPAFEEQARGEIRPSRVARAMLPGLVSRLDGGVAELGLVTWDRGGNLVTPLGREFGAVLGEIVRSRPIRTDTDFAGAITRAHEELTGPRGDPTAERFLWLVMDGREDPLPTAEIAAARADGIQVKALVFAASAWLQDADRQRRLADAVGGAEHVVVDLDPRQDYLAVEQLTASRRPTEILASGFLDLALPAGFTYIAGSAVPPATESGARLGWTLPEIPAADGLTVAYRLRPDTPGPDRPVHAGATLSYADGLGEVGTLSWPVPSVDVAFPTPTVVPTATATPLPTATPPPSPTTTDEPELRHVFLPFATKLDCLRTAAPPVDVVLVVDTSTSMGAPGPDGRTGVDGAREAMRSLLGLLDLGRDRAALVTFDAAATRRVGLTGDRSALEAALDALPLASGTRIDLGLAEAGATLSGAHKVGARPVIVLLTDGRQEAESGSALQAALDLRADGVALFTVGLGQAVDAALLAELSGPERYYPAPTAADLARVYREISLAMSCGG